MDLKQAQNLNCCWATLLIEECYRHGIEEVCIAPGSRSVPLTLAAAQHAKLRCHSHMDERGLGFFALGLAKASGKAVAIITTSGTAVANLYPAVIEARQSRVPLLVLSADRPHELLNCGANQAIIQQGIFADYPVFSCILPEPSLAIAPSLVLSRIGQAAQALKQQSGPVHINVPLREPFYPQQQQQDLTAYLAELANWNSRQSPWLQFVEPTLTSQPLDLGIEKQTLVVLGQLKRQQSQTICDWALRQGYAVLADVQSNLAAQSKAIRLAELILSSPSAQRHLHPKRVIQFGQRLLGKRLQAWLDGLSCDYLLIDPMADQASPSHRQRTIISMPPEQALSCLPEAPLSETPLSVTPRAEASSYQQQWKKAQSLIEPLVAQHCQDFSELSVAEQLSQEIESGSQLMLGNSLSVRLYELLGLRPEASIFTNRGASGIDGLLATALGLAKQQAKPTTLVLGDTSLQHDLNSLLLAQQCASSMVIVLINNQGGEIFKLLPELDNAKVAEDYFQLPRRCDYQQLAQSLGLASAQVSDANSFAAAYRAAQKHPAATLIEVVVSSGDASSRYRTLIKQADETLEHALAL